MGKINVDFGPCCRCGGPDPALTVVIIDGLAPVPGTGWGCLVCRLPQDGALAVLCRKCAKEVEEMPPASPHEMLRWVIYGAMEDHARVPVECLKGSQRHDPTKHSARP